MIANGSGIKAKLDVVMYLAMRSTTTALVLQA